MKALILAAGEGTRLRPLTLDRPKPMLPINGKPLLEHIIGWLRHHEITQIAINLHYQPLSIVSYFGDGRNFGVEIKYSYEDPILGSAGAVKRLESYFDSSFVVVYGDILTDMDLEAMIRQHDKSNAILTMGLYHVDDPTIKSVVETDVDGRIRSFKEKPRPEEVSTNLANSGVYVAENQLIKHIPPDTFYDFGHHLFPDLLAKGERVYGHETNSYLLDVGLMETYRQANEDVVARRVATY